jgi:hypothetical protein
MIDPEEFEALLEHISALEAQVANLTRQLEFTNAKLAIPPDPPRKYAEHEYLTPDGKKRQVGKNGQPLLTPEELYAIVSPKVHGKRK